MDVDMPEMDGFALAALIRQHPRYQQTAIIFISGVHLTDLDILKGYEYGAVDYLTVPIVPPLLRAKVEHAAQRAEHFALLGQLAAGLSHEIRNPLSTVFLHADLLDEELRQPSPESGAQMAEAVAEIKRQVARLDDLVQDYFSLARVATIARTPQDLGRAVEAWTHEWQPLAATQGVTLRLDGLTQLGEAVFHASTLRRAVFNLVQNALAAMPEAGTLTLAGQGTPTQVQVQVRDTGCGIPAAQLAQIFEPLYTTKPEGTGLGLYIAREIITAHAGQLTAQSAEGHGTTLTITLPRALA
jgi:two-component system sensor histidine kinase AtoS